MRGGSAKASRPARRGCSCRHTSRAATPRRSRAPRPLRRARACGSPEDLDVRRLVIVLANGLRPDAVSPSVMPSLDALGRVYTLARRARTVRPSATVAGRGRPLQDVLYLSCARLREGLDPGGVSVPTVLFLCVANSARRPEAQGLARHDAPPSAISPRAALGIRRPHD